jgi:Predicted thioesterase
MSGGGLGLPARFHFRTDLTVQARDINYGNHLGHDAAVSLLHEARRRWLAAAGYDEVGHGGAGLIMLELEVHYGARRSGPTACGWTWPSAVLAPPAASSATGSAGPARRCCGPAR